MEEQNYAKHTKLVAPFHMFLVPVLFLAFVGSLVNLYHSMHMPDVRYGSALITVLAFCGLMTAFFARIFALKAQDRAIRAEENLRHFAATGKLLDKRLKMGQIIGLRFASDGEFVALAQKAADESLTPDAIKKAIKNWRVDSDRL